jgi:ATP-dependent Lhr-like helicase
LSEEEKAEVKRLYKSANLVMAHGRKAVMALVARGVGPDTAARMLQRYCRNEEDFLRGILVAEVQYARTKRFWD